MPETFAVCLFAWSACVPVVSVIHRALCFSEDPNGLYWSTVYIYSEVNPTSFTLASLDNRVLPGRFHIARLKHAYIRMPDNSIVQTIEELRLNHNTALYNLLHLKDNVDATTNPQRILPYIGKKQ